MRVSRTLSYAVQATLKLAQLAEEGPVPCSRLVADSNMPERFLLQILRSLVTHGILRSVRGVDGGYALVHTADKTSLLEIFEAIDGPFNAALEFGDALVEDSQDNLRDALDQVTATTRRQLESIKLSQLLKPPVPSRRR
jgi:Rrf2 family protein